MNTSTAERRVTVPEGQHGRVTVERFEIKRDDLANALAAMKSGRGTAPGEYTALMINGRLWMSDTDAEWRDHMPAIRRIQRSETKRVLINGLGLGMVVQAALDCEHVEHIDVVEIDPDVVALVGPHYEASGRVTIHQGDAYDMKWPSGVAWDVVWSDIWVDLCTDNLSEMARLKRKYARRSGWHGCWGQELLQAQKRREQRMGWY
jgi:hypothetical protein